MAKQISEDAEFEIARAIREKIFRIPLMPQAEVIEMFERLNAVLYPAVHRLVEESGLVRDYFVDIIFRIASGNTLGRNYFDKEDNEDKEEKKKLLKPSEVRILSQSFSLLRLQNQNPTHFAQIVEDAGFLRGVYEEAVELFLDATAEYEDILANMEDTRQRVSMEYLKWERKLDNLHDSIRSRHPEMTTELVRQTQEAWISILI